MKIILCYKFWGGTNYIVCHSYISYYFVYISRIYWITLSVCYSVTISQGMGFEEAATCAGVTQGFTTQTAHPSHPTSTARTWSSRLSRNLSMGHQYMIGNSNVFHVRRAVPPVTTRRRASRSMTSWCGGFPWEYRAFVWQSPWSLDLW